MYRNPNPSEWKKLDLDDEYSAGQAYQRLDWLMAFDPFTSLFDQEVRRRLCNMFFSDKVLGCDKINAQTMADVDYLCQKALDTSPMARMLSLEFTTHFIDLVQTAVFAGKDEE